LAGGLIGGAVGGIAAAINGGSFLEGFADGALSGAISGAVTGAACAGLGALGALAGKSIQCMSTVGKAINVTSKVTAALSFGMDGFDMLAMGISASTHMLRFPWNRKESMECTFYTIHLYVVSIFFQSHSVCLPLIS